jgi:hypothetical protein
MSSWWIAQFQEGEGEDGVDGGELDDRAESLVVVHSRALGESPKDSTGLVAAEGAVRGQLVAKETLADDHVGAWWTRHQVPASQVCLASRASYSTSIV